MPALVLFDLDGTLLDESGLPAALRATCEAVAGLHPGLAADALVDANTVTWQRLWPEVENDWMLGGADGLSVSGRAWHETLVLCGVDDLDLERFAGDTWQRLQAEAHAVYPEVPALLDELGRARLSAGVVSNGASDVQRGKLRALGLEDRFAPVVFSSEVGVAKPDPAIFLTALGAAGRAASDAWFVGDNLWTDVLGAGRAGLRTIWVNRRGVTPARDAPRPDVVLPDLSGLLAALTGPPDRPA